MGLVHLYYSAISSAASSNPTVVFSVDLSTTVTPTTGTGSASVTRASNQQYYDGAAWQIATTDTVAIGNGFAQFWEARTNYFPGYNSDIDAGLTSVTGGTRTDDTAALDASEVAAVVGTYIYGGTSNVDFILNNPDAAAYTRQAWVRGTGVFGETQPGFAWADGTDAVQMVGAADAPYERLISENQTPPAENSRVRLQTPTGGTLYATLVDVQKGAYLTPPIVTAGAAATRAGTQLGYQSASNLPANDFTVSMTIRPYATPSAQGTVYLFGTYVDASNSTAILHDGTNLIFRKRIAGVNYDATKAFAYSKDTTYTIVVRADSTNGIDVFQGGAKGTTHVNTANIQAGASFYVAQDGNGAGFANVGVSELVVYDGVQDDAWCQTEAA